MKDLNKGENTEKRIFTGPLFIVGMPRSGTKLLRDLLNQHPRIGIPSIETKMLPKWVADWRFYGDLSQRESFSVFYRKMLCFSYFKYMKEEGRLIPEHVWYDLCADFSVSGVFEALVRNDSSVGNNSAMIWGEKTPEYISHLPLLKEIYPDARFIHIIRDVRDYCLSINRAWGKNMYRAAQRWSDDVEKARIDSRAFCSDYIEVKYEELITSPETTLRSLCSFLGVEFDPSIIELSRPSENLGDARGLSYIKKDNKEKYHHLMRPHVKKTIESISASVLKTRGYAVDYIDEVIRVNPIKMIFFKLVDGYNLFKFDLRERGFLNGLRWNLSYLKSKLCLEKFKFISKP